MTTPATGRLPGTPMVGKRSLQSRCPDQSPLPRRFAEHAPVSFMPDAPLARQANTSHSSNAQIREVVRVGWVRWRTGSGTWLAH